MSNKTIKPLILAIVSAGMLSSCVDDNYDLSDVDTTAQFNINNLTLPVNLDDIYMKNIIDTNGSDIEVINGVYAISKTGEFKSSDISIDPILMNAPNLEISLVNVSTAGLDAAVAIAGSGEIDLTSKKVNFKYTTSGVSKDILTLDEIGTNFSINIVLDFEGFGTTVNKVNYKDLVFQLPKGLHLVGSGTQGEYDAENGIFHAKDPVATGCKTVITVTADKVDSRSGFVFNPDAHTLLFQDDLYIISGKAVVNKSDLGSGTIPSSVNFVTRFEISEIDVTTFSGNFYHEITGFNLPKIDLSHLPKALAQEGTDITLLNPQIYLSLNNPAGPYNVNASTGLSITPYRGSEASEACELPEGSIFVPATSTATQNVHFCLSPDKPATYYPGFDDASHVAFPTLSRILQGNGIPSYLRVNLLSPMMPVQNVKDFPVGVNIGKVNGNYRFYTPLSFAQGSRVTYTETIDGWWSEDLNDLTVTALEVKALISTDAEIAVLFSGYPIDKNGNQIGNVEIVGANVPANAKDYPLSIKITGEIQGLDGIVFTAKAQVEKDETLKEDTLIKLSDIKATVSGYYTKEL